jgi:proteic killer suppression protein
MIVSVKDKRIAEIMAGRLPARFPPDLVRRTQKAVRMLENAEMVEDLRFPPSNRLEVLRGDRDGQWSIRSNLQWRLCFRLAGRGFADLEIVDYH